MVAAMSQNLLSLTIDETHRSLEQRLKSAMSAPTPRAHPRDVYARTDTFIAATCRHLAAVDAVILPLYRKSIPEGDQRAKEYLARARSLEHTLATLKARLYGEAHAVHLPWAQVWSDTARDLDRHDQMERDLVDALTPVLSTLDQQKLAQRVYRSEISAPTRPHPYLPHTGRRGVLARNVWAWADRFWDNAEGRVIPEPIRPKPHTHDSLLAQYLTADPHFDDQARLLAPHPPRRE